MKAIQCTHPPHHYNGFVATWLCFTYLTLRFSKKEQSFKENWMSVSKPKTAGVKDHDKQENNIQYRAITEINIPESKSKETFTYLILGTEENNKYAIRYPRQSNFNNVMINEQRALIKIMKRKKLEIH